jgi:hypothetical protein
MRMPQYEETSPPLLNTKGRLGCYSIKGNFSPVTLKVLNSKYYRFHKDVLQAHTQLQIHLPEFKAQVPNSKKILFWQLSKSCPKSKVANGLEMQTATKESH